MEVTQTIFLWKCSHNQQKITLEIKRGITASEIIISNIFNNYNFVMIEKSLSLNEILENFLRPSVRHMKEVTFDISFSLPCITMHKGPSCNGTK